MKINLTAKLVGRKNEPIMTDDNVTQMTSGFAIGFALFQTWPGDERLTVEDKLRSYRLGKLIDNAMASGQEDVEVTVEDAAFIKTKLARSWAPLIIGQLVEIIESA